MARPFEAKYGGRCAGDCGQRIIPGELVVFVDDELMHEGCEQDRIPVRERVEETCGTCWLIKPCGCDDEGKVQ